MQTLERKLVNIAGLSERRGIPIRTVRSLMSARKIPFLKFGHRTIFFDLEQVDRALQRFEVREVGSRPRREAAK
jgi:hypothetical protein